MVGTKSAGLGRRVTGRKRGPSEFPKVEFFVGKKGPRVGPLSTHKPADRYRNGRIYKARSSVPLVRLFF